MRDPLEGIPKEHFFTIDSGNHRGKLSDMICPYLRGVCRKEQCGVYDKENQQCSIVTQSQNPTTKLNLVDAQQVEEDIQNGLHPIPIMRNPHQPPPKTFTGVNNE